MDGAGEDGFNLQVAEADFYLRFPWKTPSPQQPKVRGRRPRQRVLRVRNREQLPSGRNSSRHEKMDVLDSIHKTVPERGTSLQN